MKSFKKIIRHLQNAYLKLVTGILFTSFLFIGYMITAFVKKENKPYIWHKVGRVCIFLTFILCFIRIKAHNFGNIPKGPCVIAMNHRSLIDTFSLIIMLDRYFFTITEPFDAFPNLVIQQWVFNLAYMPVIRDKNDRERFKIGMDKKYIVKKCVSRVDKGETLVIYPEAHHEMHRGLLKFKTGAVRVALEACVPLIPGTFTGTAKIMTPEHYKLHPGKIHLRFGKPIDIEKYYGKQSNHKLVRRLTKELKRGIKDLIP